MNPKVWNLSPIMFKTVKQPGHLNKTFDSFIILNPKFETFG